MCVCVQQFPYQVWLSIYSYFSSSSFGSSYSLYLCGGTIVSSSFVVTSAHCVTDEYASKSEPVFLKNISVVAIAGQIDVTTTPWTNQTRNVCRPVPLLSPDL